MLQYNYQFSRFRTKPKKTKKRTSVKYSLKGGMRNAN